MMEFAHAYTQLQITQGQRSLLAPLINEVGSAILDMDKKNILTKHKHSKLEAILKKIAIKLVDPDIYEEL